MRLQIDLFDCADRSWSFDKPIIALVVHCHILLVLKVRLRIDRAVQIVYDKLLYWCFGADTSYLVLSRFELL